MTIIHKRKYKRSKQNRLQKQYRIGRIVGVASVKYRGIWLDIDTNQWVRSVSIICDLTPEEHDIFRKRLLLCVYSS